MKELNTTDIRNVVILGGSGSGKTTLTEAAAFASGKINRLGSVLDGNTISDYDKQEKKRGFSIGLSVVPVMWNGYKINFLDTPGGIDFSGEREAAAETADAAVLLLMVSVALIMEHLRHGSCVISISFQELFLLQPWMMIMQVTDRLLKI